MESLVCGFMDGLGWFGMEANDQWQTAIAFVGVVGALGAYWISFNQWRTGKMIELEVLTTKTITDAMREYVDQIGEAQRELAAINTQIRKLEAKNEVDAETGRKGALRTVRNMSIKELKARLEFATVKLQAYAGSYGQKQKVLNDIINQKYTLKELRRAAIDSYREDAKRLIFQGSPNSKD